MTIVNDSNMTIVNDSDMTVINDSKMTVVKVCVNISIVCENISKG